MPVEATDRQPANAIAALSGYSAPYLYLLDDTLESARPHANPSAYTLRKLDQVNRAVLSGYGQGRGDLYLPWLRIRKNFSSPTSHQVFDTVGIQLRNHHFLSKLEFHTALLAVYAGAGELRECLPLWPHEHPHPNTGLDEDFDRRGETAPGLLEIARAAGIDHGTFVGTTIPFIGSLDLMFLTRQRHKWRLAGVSCKPKEITDRSERAQERIELDRLYCGAVSAHHHHEDGTSIDTELIRQLIDIRPAVSFLRTHSQTNRLQDFVGEFNRYAEDLVVAHAAIAAGHKTRLTPEDAYAFFRLGAWLHLIDIDLSQRVQMLSPIKRGGAEVIQQLRKRYMGESND